LSTACKRPWRAMGRGARSIPSRDREGVEKERGGGREVRGGGGVKTEWREGRHLSLGVALIAVRTRKSVDSTGTNLVVPLGPKNML
jgi:hypothetical protein